MFDKPRVDWLDRFTAEDGAASSVRIALASAGPMGAIVAEFITQFIPNQRLDRLQDFTEQLANRLTGLESAFQERIRESAAYASLVEEASLAAVRTPSRERRYDLAAFLRTGLSQTDADLLGHEALLGVLDGLNEVQILILISYAFRATLNDPEYEDFKRQHPGVFDVQQPVLNRPDDVVRRRWTMDQHYRSELEARGLLKDTEGIAKSATRQYTITTLGDLLVAAIGRTPRRRAAR